MDEIMRESINKYNIALSEIINVKMRENGWSQKKLGDEVSKLGIDISAATMSKICCFSKHLEFENENLRINPKKQVIYSGYMFNLIFILAICQSLGIDRLPDFNLYKDITIESKDDQKLPISDSVDDTSGIIDDAIEPAGVPMEPAGAPKKPMDIHDMGFTDYLHEPAALITNPNDPKTKSAFNGYINKSFDYYFLGTISSFQPELITGTITFLEKDDRCAIDLEIQKAEVTDYTKNSKKALNKRYTGTMIISTTKDACYCYVVNSDPKISEISSFVFHYRPFSEEGSLMIRIGVATTVCAGDDPRPTCHRVIICKKGMIKTEEEKQFIISQLLLNRSEIIISKERFSEVAKQSKVSDVIDEIRLYQSKSYYLIKESEVLNVAAHHSNIGLAECYEALAMLRLNSVSGTHRYNKIGKKADEILFRYFSTL